MDPLVLERVGPVLDAITVLGNVEQFEVTIELEVMANGRPHSRRRWSESVPRVLL